MQAAEKLTDIIYEITRQEISKTDDTILCEVVSQVDQFHYDLYAITDTTTVIHNVVNMTRFKLHAGDYCYVYKIDNSFANAFICYKLLGSLDEETAYEGDISSDVLQALSLKEDVANKITLINSASTDTEYPSAKSVYLALEEIKEIIQGSVQTYVVTTATAPMFASTAATITLTSNIVDKSGAVIYLQNLHVGDNFYVVEDAYPNRWVGNIDSTTYAATLYTTKTLDAPVKDIKLNSESIVTSSVGLILTTGGITSSGNTLSLSLAGSNGVKTDGNAISLSLDGCATIKPTELTLDEQKEIKIYLSNTSGTTVTTSLNDLDYTKLRVTDTEDLTSINVNDFLFVKE